MTKNNKKYFILYLFIILSLSLIFNGCCDCNDNTINPTQKIISESFYYTINQQQWIEVEKYHWYTRISVPSITISTIDNGAVLVYYKNNVNTWVLLPYTTTLVNKNNDVYNEEIWSGFALGTVDIDYVYTNPLDPTPVNKLQLKIVVLNYY